MEPLLSAAQMRQADQYTIGALGIPEMVLMEHAALSVVDALKRRFGKLLPDTRGVVVAGTGNNGGDALAAARILAQNGTSKFIIVLLGDEKSLSASAAIQLHILGRLGIAWSRELTAELLTACDWVIDGIFGTGLSRPLSGEAEGAVALINRFQSRHWVVSVDIPSGLSADTGTPLGNAVHASETVTLGFIKRGLVTGLAADYVGRLTLSPIQIPRTIPSTIAESFLYGFEDALRLPERKPTSHKGRYGHVYVFVGVPDKQGAAGLVAMAALRAGTGLATLVGRESDLEVLRARLPVEIMTAPWEEDLFQKLSAKVGVLGPGMHTGPEGEKRLQAALQSNWSWVLDADALNTLAEMGDGASRTIAKRNGAKTVLTPHPKEAARLLGVSVDEVQGDRYAACEKLVAKYGAFICLKGKGTVIGGPELPMVVVTAGNTALAKGGSGDVLSGIIASLLAQGVRPRQAVPLAAFLHGRAAEIHTERHGHERSALASEITAALPEVFREIDQCKRT